jgi:sugar (pentulose or hexulose) kinase
MLGCQTIGTCPACAAADRAADRHPNTDWFNNNFSYADKARAKEEGRSVFALYDEEIAKINPGCNGNHLPPVYERGRRARSPFTNTDARGNFFGLNMHSDRHTSPRGVRSMAFANKHCLDAFTYPVSDIRLSGGGTKSRYGARFSRISATRHQPARRHQFGAKASRRNARMWPGCSPT